MKRDAYYKFSQVSKKTWEENKLPGYHLPRFESDVFVDGVANAYKFVDHSEEVMVRTNHRSGWNEFTAFLLPADDFRELIEGMEKEANQVLAKAQEDIYSISLALKRLNEKGD